LLINILLLPFAKFNISVSLYSSLSLPFISTEFLIMGICESGRVVDLDYDEPLSFPTIFLNSGIKLALSPMWEVKDSSTFLYIQIFLEKLLMSNVSDPYKAQEETNQFFKTADKEIILQKIDQIIVDCDLEKYDQDIYGKLMLLRDFFRLNRKVKYLLKDPYYWAGFQLLGFYS